MHIIEPGEKNRVTCAFCGAILEYKKTDIQVQEKYSSPRDSHTVEYLVCPQCEAEINLIPANTK